MPILNARPPDYVDAETNYRVTSGQNTVDFWTGIPVIQGNIRAAYAAILPVDPIGLEYNSGSIYLEGNDGFLMQESSDKDVYLRVTQQTGEPPGGLNESPGTNFQVPGDDDPGLPYENVVVPKTGPITK